MSKSRESILETITCLVNPVLDDQCCELVDVEYLQENGRWVVRILAEKEGGITLDDCARLSREIGNLLDAKDVIDHGYVLEVSSPGLDRPLKKEKDFAWAVGRHIKVRTKEPVQERLNFKGRLERFENGFLDLDVGDQLVQIPCANVKKANLIYGFDS